MSKLVKTFLEEPIIFVLIVMSFVMDALGILLCAHFEWELVAIVFGATIVSIGITMFIDALEGICILNSKED